MRSNGYGYLVPPRRDPTFSRAVDLEQVGGSSTQGLVLLRVFAGRFGGRDVTRDSDEELVDLARRELRSARDRGRAATDSRPPLAPRYAAVRPRPSRATRADRRGARATTRVSRSPVLPTAASGFPTASTPARRPRARSRRLSQASPDDARDLRAALRRGSRADAGRRLVAGARVPGGRRRPALHRARRGRVPRRRGRQSLSRLRPLLGAADSRSRASSCGRGARGGDPPRDELRRAEPARARARAARPRRDAEHRARALRELGHRGDHERAPGRARVHRALEDRQVHRLLPRPRRSAARAGRLGGRDARTSGLARRDAGRRRETR